MSMAHSHQPGKTIECALLVVLALVAWGGASARKSDRSQLIQVAADNQKANLSSNGQVILTGHVKITQGSLLIQGAKAIGYENQDNQWDHAVVTGLPARFQQQLDNGSMVHGSADTIDYLVSENTVILTGHATVMQQGRGEFHGAKLTYNTDTGEIVGKGGAGGQVHMTFQPKSKPTKPAPASTRPSAASPASGPGPASSPASTPGTPPSPVSPSAPSTSQPPQAPASASTAGTH